MVIYGEWLFLENAVVGCLLILLTGRAAGRHQKRSRMILGGLACGLYSFTLFFDFLPVWVGVLTKAGFSILLMFFIYGKRQLWKLIIIFYLMTMALGGAVIALLYFFDLPALTGGGGIYIGSVRAWQIVPGAAVGFFGLWALCGFFRSKALSGKTLMEVEVEIDGHRAALRGLVDTGNFLRDPVSGKPVFLVTESAVSQLLGAAVSPERFCCIPFCSVGEKSGLLEGIRPDRIGIFENGTYRPVEAVLGIYKNTFPPAWNGEEYQLLLHPAVLD